MFMDSNTNTELEKSELDYYLEESLLPRNIGDFDILCWWKTNGIKYPILHNIVKDVLAIPVTTVASESTFSTGGRVLSVHRNRLHPKTVEALMCARDWLWSEMQGIIFFLMKLILILSSFFICNVYDYFVLLDSTISKDQNFDDDSDVEVS
ncbi:hypothetical protein F511_25448 [Dorcoceras hygrometricum]|uniref:HAT C-terminal dimerisation domain-containing protein n=1 Tax=Dorcoceras hygrometricum TaxID=472368 RepID=A0A2Z7A8T3_9LAMI|nr:hypothetical protein F511_25448 [Dorcoceras hygrometricum]